MPSLQILHSGVYVSLCAVPLCTMASRGHQVSGSILIVLFAWDRISHWALNYTFQAGLACKWTTPPIPPGIWLSLSLIAGVTGTSSYSHLQRGYREFRGSRVCAARVLTYWVISLGPNFAGFFFHLHSGYWMYILVFTGQVLYQLSDLLSTPDFFTRNVKIRVAGVHCLRRDA